MRSHSTILSLTLIALLGAASAATARPLNYAPAESGLSRHHQVAAVRALDAVAAQQSSFVARSAATPYDGSCRARNRMQSWGYETCLQDLRASAMTGGGGY